MHYNSNAVSNGIAMRTLEIGKDFYRREYASYMDDVSIVRDMLHMAMKHIDKYLSIPDDMSVILKPLREFQGVWLERERVMQIDPILETKKRNLGIILSTFIHEAVHAEQCLKGYLQFKEDGVYWYGEKKCVLIDDLSYDDYMALPWEVDARIKQDALVGLLAEDIVNSVKK